MSVSLEEKTVEVMDRALNGFDKLTVVLSDIADKYGAETVDAVITVVQIKGVDNLARSLFSFSFILLIIIFGRRMLRWAKGYQRVSDGFSWMAISCVTVAIMAPTISGLLGLLNPWPWVAIIEPKLWIAHEILKW